MTRIEPTYLTPSELAARWKMSAGTLANWRVHGFGPAWFKSGIRVLYLESEVVRYEKRQLQTKTKRPKKLYPRQVG